jgi:hypothetical protein
MNTEQWDETAFRASIPVARKQVELAARFCEAGPSQPHWDSRRPVVELIFYLCKLDYDIKVLVLHFFTDLDNRAIWERYLALELHEALHTLPKAISRARIEIAKPTTASHMDLSRFDAAVAAYRREAKKIQSDKDFIRALSLVRNGVAAHHGLSKGKGMDASIAWTLNACRLTQSYATPFHSQVAEYAVKLGRAIQDLGEDAVSDSQS